MSTKPVIFPIVDFAGGWNTRNTPLFVLDGSNGPMQSPDLLNCDFLYSQGVQKRLGKTKVGNNVGGGSAWVDFSTYDLARNTASPNYPTYSFMSICFKVVPGSTKNVAAVSAYFGINIASTLTKVRCVIKSNLAGSPGGTISGGESSYFNGMYPIVSAGRAVRLLFPGVPSLTSGTTYWLCFEIFSNVSQAAATFSTARNTSFTTAADVQISFDNYTTFTNDGAVGRGAYLLEATTPAMQGLYDYRWKDASGAINQDVMAVSAGGIYYKDGSNWTALKTGLANGQDYIYDFATYKNHLYMCDYSQSNSQVWDSQATGTMAHGYRLSNYYTAQGMADTIASIAGAVLTMAASQSASGLYKGKLIYLTGGAVTYPEIIAIKDFATTGTPGTANYYVTSITLETPSQTDRTTVKWNSATVTVDTGVGTINVTTPATCVRILPVTQMKSGGYRAGDEISVDVPNGTTGRILLSNIAMNSSTDGTQFAFDIPTAATKWFMTPFFDPTVDPILTTSGVQQQFYKLAAADLSTAVNPMANSVTAFNIIDEVAGTENTLLLEYNLAQSYFTSQVDMPRAKFLENFGNFLVTAGDPNNLSSLWIMQQLAPQIANTYGLTLGQRLDISPDDGQIITGLYYWQSRLFVFKNRSTYVITFTGNAVLPFNVDKLQGNIGCLSNWTMQETPKGIVFLSQRGPAICYGSYVDTIPEAKNILNLFDRNDSQALNLSAMQYSTSLNNETKSQIYFGIASTGSSIRDQVLMYDYEKGIFWPNTGISGNFFTTIGDGNGFPQPYSGDYMGQVFVHDSGRTDHENRIDWSFSTGHFAFKDINAWKGGRRLFISGEPTNQGNDTHIYIDEYDDFATTPSYTYTIEMNDAAAAPDGIGFRSGRSVSLISRAQYMRFVVKSADIINRPKIESMKIEVDDQGENL